MNQRDRAIHYFALQCGRDEFWQWAADGAAVLWADGSLVATRDELVSVLRRLQPTGLPPFGALVHLLAGCCGQVT